MQRLMSASSPCVRLDWYDRAAGGWVGSGPRNCTTGTGKRKCEDQTGIQECAQSWAWAGMRPLSEKSPASTDRRLHGREREGAEKCSQEAPGRSVPGIGFQPQHESSTPQTDESTESMDLGVGVGNCSTEWMSPLANECGVKGERRPQRKKVHWGQDGVLHPCVG